MFSACLYLLEWKKSFRLGEISPLTWISRQNFTEMWAPLKFLLFPIRYRFPSFLKKNQALWGQTFLTQFLGMGCNSPFAVIGPCSGLSWLSQWTLATVTLGHSVCFSWRPHDLGACGGWSFRGIQNVQHIQTFADHRGQLIQLSLRKTCMCEICLIRPGLCCRLRCFWFPTVSSGHTAKLLPQRCFLPRCARNSSDSEHKGTDRWKNKEPCIICL